MSYLVDYTDEAEDSLTDLWMRADNPNAIARASDRCELALANDPMAVGESRGGRRRVAFFEPLMFHYRVNVAKREVLIVNIFRYPPLP